MNKDPGFQMSMFSGPIPGEALTHPPKGMPWQQPPQHTKLEDVMLHLMHQLTEPQHLKQLLGLMEGGMSIEAITRTILFMGFSSGKWTPDLAMLMYKPLMLSLTAIAHKGGMKDTPLVMKESMGKHLHGKMRNRVMIRAINRQPLVDSSIPLPNETSKATSGFMSKGTK